MLLVKIFIHVLLFGLIVLLAVNNLHLVELNLFDMYYVTLPFIIFIILSIMFGVLIGAGIFYSYYCFKKPQKDIHCIGNKQINNHANNKHASN